MKKMISLLVLGLLLMGSVQISASSDQTLYWNQLIQIYDTYIEYPSDSNGRALLDALPRDRPIEEKGNAERALRHIYSPDSYPVLYEEAICGGRTAIEVHFRLLNIGGGIYNESVEALFGVLVRNYPALILEVLASYKNTKHVKAHGFPIAFVGFGHNTHPKSAIYVLEKRIEALETVRDSNCREIREACIRQIREAIKHLADIIDESCRVRPVPYAHVSVSDLLRYGQLSGLGEDRY